MYQHFLKLMPLRLALTLSTLSIVSGCASLAEHSVTVSANTLEHKLQERIQDPISVLKLFKVQLSNPVITLNPQTERLHAKLDAGVSSLFQNKPLKGSAALSGKLRFDEPTLSVILADPKLESINIDGFKNNELISTLAQELSGDLLNNLTLYTLKPDELKFAGIRFKPKHFKVTQEGLQVLLSP